MKILKCLIFFFEKLVMDTNRTFEVFKKKNPENFMNMDEVLKDSERVFDGIDSVNSNFILTVIGKCAQNNGKEVYCIY